MKENFKVEDIIIVCWFSLGIALSITFFWFTVKTVNWQLDQNEIQECKKWTLEANKLNDYYFTQWQADQCSAHGIQVNAPIK